MALSLQQVQDALKAGPPFSQEVQQALLGMMFSGQSQASPVPGVYNAAKAKALAAQASFQTAWTQAKQEVLSYLAANSGILTAPTSVSGVVWLGLQTAVGNVLQIGGVDDTTQNDFTNYLNALDGWNTANSGSLTPKPLPAVPPSVQPFLG